MSQKTAPDPLGPATASPATMRDPSVSTPASVELIGDAPIAAGRSGAAILSSHEVAGRAPDDANEPAPSTRSASHPFARAEARRYESIAELGAGGMGHVRSAFDHRLQRPVALKQVGAELRNHPQIADRFAREAWITASLDHPAIVPIFDAGQDRDGGLYYTMRLIRGRTLTTAITQAGNLTARLSLIRQFLVACEAIAYAHSRGIVHRDLKPDNILVGEFGETQVVDWGLARRLDEDYEQAPQLPRSPTNDAAVTAQGAVLGTPAYMAPEQARGASGDRRSDVYSLGQIFFEIVMGQRLFADGSARTVLAAMRSGARPRLSPMLKDVPRELGAILEKALAIDPTQRYPDARALAADISQFLDGRRVSAHRYSALQELALWLRPYRLPLLVAGIAMILLWGLALWAFRRTSRERDAARQAETRARTALREADRHLSRALVEQALSAQGVEAQADAEVLAAHALTLTESPDARGVLAAMALADRPVLQERTPLPRCQSLRLRRDGAILCIEPGAVALWQGRPLRRIFLTELAVEDATWLDERGTAAVSTPDQHALVLDGQSGVQLQQPGGPLLGPRGWLDATGTEGVAYQLNPRGISRLHREGGVVPELTPCRGRGTHLAAAFNATQRRLAVACSDGLIVLCTPDGRELGRISTPMGTIRPGVASLAFAPDGSRLAAAGLDGGVQVLAVEGGTLHRELTHRNGFIRSLHFSPDGRRLLLLSDRGGATLWEPATQSPPRHLPLAAAQTAAWDADGQAVWIAGSELLHWMFPPARPLRLPVDTGGPGLAGAVLSPDGRSVALARGDGFLEVLSTESGLRQFIERAQDGVLKGVHYLHRGTTTHTELLTWGMGQPGLRRYSMIGEVLQSVPMASLRRAALFPSGWLVALSYSLELRLYDVRREPPTTVIFPTRREPVDAAQSHDERSVAVLDLEGMIYTLVDQAPQPVLRRLGQRADALALALSATGDALAVALPGRIEIIDMASGQTRHDWPYPGRQVLDVALSADGRYLATADLDQLARVFSLETGALMAVLRGHSGGVASVSFSADSQTLVSASWDGTARLWGLRVLDQPAQKLLEEAEKSWGITLASLGGTQLGATAAPAAPNENPAAPQSTADR